MKNRYLRVLALCLMLCLLIPSAAQAKTPYKTYTVNGYGEIQETQTAYTVEKMIPVSRYLDEYSEDFEISELTDMAVVTDEETGEPRIYISAILEDVLMAEPFGAVLVGSAKGELIRMIRTGGSGKAMLSPQGICVAPSGRVYVADDKAEAVFEFADEGSEGRLLHVYTKPTNPLYGASTPFKPLKVAVNRAGILYIICDGNSNGIVEISPGQDGEEDAFLGYFGTNLASVSMWDIFLRSIRTAEQRAMSGSTTRPRTPTDLDIDERGLIYTVTLGDGMNTLKRLNIAGSNLIGHAMSVDLPVSVTAGSNDNVYIADSSGFLYEFSSDGDLIFVFSGKDDGTRRAGLFTEVAGIDEGPDGRIYVLDPNEQQRAITVFAPTEFTRSLHEALALYSVGRYTESKTPLEMVLDMNSMFDVANKAMGRAYFQEENYGEALRFARLAKDKSGYSDAYWEVRNVWLKRNISIAFIAILALFVLWKIIRLLDRRFGFLKRILPSGGPLSRSRYLSDLRYAFYYMRHPIDGSYGIAREGRASWAVSLTLLVIFIVEFLINKYLCGFLQKTVQDGRYEVLSDVGMLLAAVIGLVGCNYLVCTINEGEGTVKKIASYFCYSLTPYILLTPVIFLLSQVLTRNEQFLIDLIGILAWAWMLVLLVLGIREVNNYTAKQTAKVILLTLFTLLILALIIFILYVLWAQVFRFFGEIIGEVRYRAG